MNIGVFTDTYLPSINGIVTSVEIFRKELEKNGHKVYIFCPKVRKYARKTKDQEKGGNIFRYFSMPYPLLREFRLVIPFPSKLKSIKKLRLDIIHFHTPLLMGVFASYLSKRLKIPLIQTFHTHLIEYLHYVPLPKKVTIPFTIWGIKKYCHASTFVISPSTLIKNTLIDYGVKTDIAIIPTGTEVLKQAPLSPEQIKKKYRIPLDKRILIYIGRLAKEKNIFFLFKAFSLINKKIPNCLFILIGDGPERSRLMHKARKMGLANKILFLGYIEHKETMNILSVSDIFIFSSITETQGLCLLEAMSKQIPVVAVKAMGVIDIIMSNQGGYLVEEDEVIFSDKVIALLNNKELYREKSKQALEVANRFTAGNLTKELLCYYDKALKIFSKS